MTKEIIRFQKPWFDKPEFIKPEITPLFFDKKRIRKLILLSVISMLKRSMKK